MDFSKFKIKKIKNKTFYQGRPLTILDISRNDNKMIKRNELIKMCVELRDDLRDVYKDGLIAVSIKYPERWYSASPSKLSDERVNIFSMDQYDEFDEDPEEYPTFRFSFIPLSDAEGGHDEHNDCLINCIKKFVQRGAAKLNASQLKEVLGLKRDDMVSIANIPDVEKYINHHLGFNNYAINVCGDYSYKSLIPSNKIIRLILSNNHYSLDVEEVKHQNSSYTEKPILMFCTQDFKEYQTYDGTHKKSISKEQYNKYMSFSSKYTMIEKNYCKDARDLTIEDSYQLFINMADQMKKKTHGRINFYRSGSVKQAALKYFYELNTAVQPDEIEEDNAAWINEASFAALMYWQPFNGNVHLYDINSHYPNIMRRNYHYFPIKDGEFKMLSKDEFLQIIKKPTPDYGIYRCKITKKNINPCKFFRFNPNNKYTHLDIACAVLYDLNIDLIEDGKPNCLFFSKDKLMNGAFLFKKYVQEFYKLKSEGVAGAKQLLNVLWGALGESRFYNKKIEYDEEANIDHCEIKYMNTGDTINIKCLDYGNKRYFKTNYARIKPFILSYGRHAMMKIFTKYEDLVVRMHTDGFYLKDKPSDILTGPNIGNLKYEGEYKVVVTGINKMVKEKIG